ncbi:hypothetical protein D3C87_1855130 [compost metagenome]
MMMPPLYKPMVERQSSTIGGTCILVLMLVCHPGIMSVKCPAMAIPANTSATAVTTFAGRMSLRYPINLSTLLTLLTVLTLFIL